MGAMTDLKKPLVWNPFTMTCDTTGYTMSTETFWVLWGHPMDTYELTKRTGSAPVVTFPLVRGPYPSYSTDSHGDDAMDLYPKIKEWLVYLGAFSASELDGYDVEPSEGAEQGVVAQIGAMAAYIAKQTCNRDIYILSEAPSYGYSLSTAAKWAEKLGGFKEGCSSGDTISISMIGWLPGTPFPTAVGADNITYSADSTSPNSPWMESLVFPENPSGVINNTRLDSCDFGSAPSSCEQYRAEARTDEERRVGRVVRGAWCLTADPRTTLATQPAKSGGAGSGETMC